MHEGPHPVDAPPHLSLGQRLLLSLPTLRHTPREDRAPLGERFRSLVLKPRDPDAPPATPVRSGPRTEETVEGELRSADDKERIIGLIAAPFAAAIGLLVTGTLISHDPAATLANGALNPRHVSVSLYHDLTLVTLALAVLMLGFAWFRKRLFLGIVTALYGLTIFNLHYWGFGVPFIMAAAWLLVRSYRLQRELREARGDLPVRGGGNRAVALAGRPGANKRYTPPTPTRRALPARREKEPRPG
ncbi:MAG TPA: hypothetical protein VMB72_13630 [Acidimicrobiales bacterium]|nr:hypothetical protein [Acidimicrobiales bacterium]